MTQKYHHPKNPVSSSMIRPHQVIARVDHREHPLHHLQHMIGNQAVQQMVQAHAETRVLQTKLAINQPGDTYEQEADHVAEQVMRMPEPQLQRACACGGTCSDCQEEQSEHEHEHEQLQMKRVDANSSGPRVAPPIVNDVLSSPGYPLDPTTRAFMEPRFGLDLSRVRVHTNALAEQSARDVHAQAYTVEHNIVFDAGRFAPGTHDGRRLLAHELTHVAQQSGAIQMQDSFAVQRSESQNARRKVAVEPKLQRKEDDTSNTAPVKQPQGEKNEKKKTEVKEQMTNCRKNYMVESWEKDTCCVNHGFPDPSAKNKKTGAACCNTFPAFVDNEAVKLGFDGAASCRSAAFLNHRARVTPGSGGKSTVEVLCVDTRRKKAARVIELGFKAAQKAYGSTSVSDQKATVCIGDKKEATTCFLETDCDKTKNPKESQCMSPNCSKTDESSTEKQDGQQKKTR